MKYQSTNRDAWNKRISAHLASDFYDVEGWEAEFLVSDVLQPICKIDQKFDVVFTSYGTIGWLPDLNKWSKVISHYLKPKGKLIFADFHPVIWMFDDAFEKIEYSYFQDEVTVETTTGAYADTEAPFEKTEVSWNHGLSEVFYALDGNGLILKSFDEYDYSS